jgi:group I intron endonuclease
MNIGIYKITNLVDNKVYIGSSVDVYKRQYKHFWMLRKNQHDNVHLQNSYNKFGEINFVFSVIELCEVENLIPLENKYITTYKSNDSNFGYNLATVNDFRRNTYNDEVKLKLSKYNQSKNGNFKKFSLTDIDTQKTFVFDNLIDVANYLINNGFAKGKHRNVRSILSSSLRGKKVNNGYKGSIRKTCYKHTFNVIN